MLWVTAISGSSNKKYGNYIWSKNMRTGKWKRDNGLAVKIAVDGSGSPWVVNKLGNIFYKYKGRGGWKMYAGKAKEIAANGKAVAIIGTDNGIYRLNHETKDWAFTNAGKNCAVVSIDNDGRLNILGTRK